MQAHVWKPFTPQRMSAVSKMGSDKQWWQQRDRVEVAVHMMGIAGAENITITWQRCCNEMTVS